MFDPTIKICSMAICITFHILLYQTRLFRGRSQTTLTNFWAFLTPLPPWLTALINEIYGSYLVTLTFRDPPYCQRSL